MHTPTAVLEFHVDGAVVSRIVSALRSLSPQVRDVTHDGSRVTFEFSTEHNPAHWFRMAIMEAERLVLLAQQFADVWDYVPYSSGLEGYVDPIRARASVEQPRVAEEPALATA